MRLAERALREENIPVSVLARSLGYGSESAFSNAFKRVTGNAPTRYRTAARGAGANGESNQSEGLELLRPRQAEPAGSPP